MINTRNLKIGKNELIPLNFDYMFTGIFNNKENMELIESFVGVFLDIKPSELKGCIKILSRELSIENKREKNNSVDLLLDYKGKKINIELNNESKRTGVIDRNIIYACKVHGKGLNYGEYLYTNIRPTIQLNFNTNIKNKNEVIETYYLRNDKNEILSEKLKIEMIDVVKGASMCYNQNINPKYAWCKLLMTKSRKEQEDILKEIGEEIMGKSVKDKLKEETKKYSEDEENYALYTKLSHEEICRNTEIYNAKKEAIKENSITIAKNMLKDGETIEKIIKYCELSPQEVLLLKE